VYELQQDIDPSLGEGEDLSSNQVTEDGTSSLVKRSRGNLST